MGICALTSSCTHFYKWESFLMDSHRTGVSVPAADNVPQAIGTMQGDVYTAPNGKFFAGGATAAVAKELIAVQPQMADLKRFVCYAPHELVKKAPESELTNFLVDHLMEDVQNMCDRKVDVGIINFGGIRTDIPKGDVLKDDVVAMLPFKNYLCYVAVSGEELLGVFEHFARTHVQVIGGARFECADGHIESLTVGGETIDPSRTYGIATLDFLLDGGDDLYLARNARELIITECKFVDSVLPRLEAMGRAGVNFEYHLDGRVKQTISQNK